VAPKNPNPSGHFLRTKLLRRWIARWIGWIGPWLLAPVSMANPEEHGGFMRTHGNIQYGTYIGKSWDLFQTRFIGVAIWGWFQWPWLRNRLIGGTYHIFLAYFLGLCKGISQQNMAWTMVQYLHFRILKFPLMNGGFHGKMSYTPWRICPLVCFITGGYLQHPAAGAPSPVTSCFIIYDHIWLSICTT